MSAVYTKLDSFLHNDILLTDLDVDICSVTVAYPTFA